MISIQPAYIIFKNPKRKQWLALLPALFVAGMALTTTRPAEARVANGQRITEINVTSTGIVFFRTTFNFTTSPACIGQGWIHYMAFNSTTTAGDRLLKTLTAAFLAGKRVNIIGTDSCVSATHPIEVLDFVKVRND